MGTVRFVDQVITRCRQMSTACSVFTNLEVLEIPLTAEVAAVFATLPWFPYRRLNS